MTDEKLTVLERAVLNEICGQYPGDRALLDAQVTSARVARRENTGAGFFTYLVTSQEPALKITAGENARGWVHAKLDCLKYDMGFILFLEDGFVSCLEGYLTGDETTVGLDLVNAGFQITDVAPPVKG